MKITAQLLIWGQFIRDRNTSKIKSLGCGHGARYNGATVRDEVQTKYVRL